MIKQHVSTPQKERAAKLFLKGESTAIELKKNFGVSRSTIYEWVNDYENRKTLNRVKNPKSGRQPTINQTNGKAILKILKLPASKFGYETDFWTTSRLRQTLSKKLNLKMSRMAIYRTLKKLKQSYHKPESRYYHKDKEKNLAEWRNKTVPAIKRVLRKCNAVLYFEDESNISLTPTLAKTWGPIGEKIIRSVSPNRGSVSAISAISRSGFLIFNVHDGGKRFNSDDIISFLSQMLKHHKRRHLVVVMDQAPCHKSKKVKEFTKTQKRLHVFYLPPRSPEFNPDEMVWAHLKEKELKEHKATTTKELKKLAKKKLKRISKNRKLVFGIFKSSEGSLFFA